MFYVFFNLIKKIWNGKYFKEKVDLISKILDIL